MEVPLFSWEVTANDWPWCKMLPARMGHVFRKSMGKAVRAQACLRNGSVTQLLILSGARSWGSFFGGLILSGASSGDTMIQEPVTGRLFHVL